MRKYQIHLSLAQGLDDRRRKDQIHRASDLVLANFGCFALPLPTALKYDGKKSVEIVKLEFLTDDEIPQKSLGRLKNHLRDSSQIDSVMITACAVDLV